MIYCIFQNQHIKTNIDPIVSAVKPSAPTKSTVGIRRFKRNLYV